MNLAIPDPLTQALVLIVLAQLTGSLIVVALHVRELIRR